MLPKGKRTHLTWPMIAPREMGPTSDERLSWLLPRLSPTTTVTRSDRQPAENSQVAKIGEPGCQCFVKAADPSRAQLLAVFAPPPGE